MKAELFLDLFKMSPVDGSFHSARHCTRKACKMRVFAGLLGQLRVPAIDGILYMQAKMYHGRVRGHLRRVT